MVAGFRPFSVQRAGMMPMDFSMAASLLDHSLKLRLNFFEAIGCKATAFAVDWWARCGFDVVYHPVSYLLSSENGWTS